MNQVLIIEIDIRDRFATIERADPVFEINKPDFYNSLRIHLLINLC